MRRVIRGKSSIEVVEVDVPRPRPADVLVRVRAAALNRADLTVAAGERHGKLGGPGTPLGMEWAGEIVALGSAVAGWKVGDRVMSSGHAAFSDYALADHRRILPLPGDQCPFDVAATLPVALQTMHDAVVTNGGFARGESVLIQGASSGVGLMGLLIARELGASTIIGSARDAGRRARLAAFGAHVVVDPDDPGWPDAVRAATGDRGVDLIVDQLAGTAMNGNLHAAALAGRIVNVGRMAGTHGDFDFDLHALKRIRYIGVTFRTRTVDDVRLVVERMMADLWPAVVAGRLALPIAERYPLERIGDAFETMAANRHFGKIVVTFD